MNSKKLEELLEEEESIHLEFKEALDLSNANARARAKFLREVLSLANSPIRVGYLVIGIEDETKRTIGINGITEEQVQQIIAEYCRPKIKFDFSLVEHDGKKVGVMVIYPVHPPYTLTKSTSYDELVEELKKPKTIQLRPNQVFLRRGSIIGEADPDEIIEMAQRDVTDISDIVSEMNRMTNWLEEIADNGSRSHFPRSSNVFSHTIETTFVAMLTGLLLAWMWEYFPPALIPLLAGLVSFFAIVTTSALRLTHFGFARAVFTSINICMGLGLLFQYGQGLALVGGPIFGQLATRLIFGLFAGAISGVISQIIAGWFENQIRR